MIFYSIASGSSGNCYYIESDNKKILVDAGISFRRIKNALEEIERDIKDLDALFISHEHTDHVAALPMLNKHTDLQVFSSAGTLEEVRNKFPELDFARLNDLEVNSHEDLFGFAVRTFSVFHDAADPVGYVFEKPAKDKRIGIVTDTGRIDENIIEMIKDVNLLVLEANYDEHSLKTGNYPNFLKKRILSSQGHLSNLEAAKILHDICHQDLSHVFLGHLSKENNLPFIARKTICTFLDDFKKEMHFELDTLSRNMPGQLINL